jgi:sulfoxide reductase heme-binding subunit YedZ
MADAAAMSLIWPWQDRGHGFCALKATTFALMFAPGAWTLYQFATGEFGSVPLGGMTYWSGVWATSLLVLALAVTPLLTILRWSRLMLVRRMIGVTALLYTLAHIVIYFGLRRWDWLHIGHEMVTRLSLIIATVATLGLIALGVTSVDAAVRRMGARGWQRLHDIVYTVAGLALVHYLLSPDIYPEQYLLAGLFAWLMAWRVLNRHGYGTDIRALMLLALAASAFTALLEAGWIWAYHGFAPAETLAENFSLVLGVAPAWKVLGLGLLIAATAAVRQAPIKNKRILKRET